MSSAPCNGWANYETWNVALWIGNDEYLYNLARPCATYKEFRKALYDVGYSWTTKDAVFFSSKKLDYDELDELIAEF